MTGRRAVVSLDSRSVEALADAVALRLQKPATSSATLLTSQELAATLGRSASWIRDHADELGAIRIGDGPRPRLLFDLSEVEKRLASCSSGRGSEPDETPANAPNGRRRRTVPLGTTTELLPVKGVRQGHWPVQPTKGEVR